MKRTLYSVALLVALTACNSSRASSSTGRPSGPIGTPTSVPTGSASAPVQPTLPKGITVKGGKPLFSLDTSEPDVALPIHGGPPGVVLDARLASTGGQREIRLTDSYGRAELVAPSGWNILAVAAFQANGDLAVCWNLLTGPESAPGAMPHPSAGLALKCRLRQSGKYGKVIDVAPDTAPAWLVDVTASSGSTYIVKYYRNKDGWLITPPSKGDGVFTRTLSSSGLGSPTPASP